MLSFRVEYTRRAEQLSPWPITTRLYVRVHDRAQLYTAAAELFTQVYRARPEQLDFELTRSWSADSAR